MSNFPLTENWTFHEWITVTNQIKKIYVLKNVKKCLKKTHLLVKYKITISLLEAQADFTFKNP